MSKLDDQLKQLKEQLSNQLRPLFEKLPPALKAKLPFLKKNEDEAALAPEEEAVPGKADKTQAGEIPTEEGTEAPPPKKKRKIGPIHMIVIAGLLYFTYDYFMAEPEQPALPPTPPPVKKTKRIRPNQATAQAASTAVTQESASATATATPMATETPVPAATEAPAATATVAAEPTPEKTPEASATPEAIATPETAPTSEPSASTPPTETSASATAPTPAPEKPTPTPSKTDSEVEDEPTKAGEVGEVKGKTEKGKADVGEEIIANVEDTVKDEEIVDSKIPKPLVPDYIVMGRGLVYNCKEKHWACVDSANFFQCKKLKEWSKRQKKRPDCVDLEVYSTEKDCKVTQTHKIDTSADTSFCK